jgi:hypothetical protein
MNIIHKLLIALSCALPVLCLAGNGKSPSVICPLKPDPPPLIDGNPREWQSLPGTIEISGEQVQWGKAKWKNKEDLSGFVNFCWDENYLYVLAQVTDDKVLVTKSGKYLVRADHIELDIDPVWKAGCKGGFTKQQFIIGMSPGNMEHTGDPMLDSDPEFYIYCPQNIQSAEGIDVASARTEKGYLIEACIPWKLLGTKPEQGDTIGLDIHLSDSDNVEDQEKMTSLYPGAWKGRKRENMIPVMLTGAKVK